MITLAYAGKSNPQYDIHILMPSLPTPLASSPHPNVYSVTMNCSQFQHHLGSLGPPSAVCVITGSLSVIPTLLRLHRPPCDHSLLFTPSQQAFHRQKKLGLFHSLFNPEHHPRHSRHSIIWQNKYETKGKHNFTNNQHQLFN